MREQTICNRLVTSLCALLGNTLGHCQD